MSYGNLAIYADEPKPTEQTRIAAQDAIDAYRGHGLRPIAAWISPGRQFCCPIVAVWIDRKRKPPATVPTDRNGEWYLGRVAHQLQLPVLYLVGFSVAFDCGTPEYSTANLLDAQLSDLRLGARDGLAVRKALIDAMPEAMSWTKQIPWHTPNPSPITAANLRSIFGGILRA